MSRPQHIELNKAIVLLKKLGFSFNTLKKVLKISDKRNIARVWRRDKDVYFLPNELKSGQKIN